MSPRAFRVGLTGGIASGKSTVARLFNALGTPVIDTDEISREVTAPGQPLLARIAERFGPQVLNQDGSLNRVALREQVFSDDASRTDLENLTHPAILAEMERRAGSIETPYVLLAIPLLVEKHLQRRVDRVLVVDCEESLQIHRLQARDGTPLPRAQAILKAQAARAARLAAADDVLQNNGDLAALRDRIEALHIRYLELARQARP